MKKIRSISSPTRLSTNGLGSKQSFPGRIPSLLQQSKTRESDNIGKHKQGLYYSDSPSNGVQSISRSYSALDASESRANGSPLKIRIPGRLQQKVSSNAGNTTPEQHAIPMAQIRPRRSLRHQPAMNGMHSERSVSFDSGQSV